MFYKSYVKWFIRYVILQFVPILNEFTHKCLSKFVLVCDKGAQCCVVKVQCSVVRMQCGLNGIAIVGTATKRRFIRYVILQFVPILNEFTHKCLSKFVLVCDKGAQCCVVKVQCSVVRMQCDLNGIAIVGTATKRSITQCHVLWHKHWVMLRFVAVFNSLLNGRLLIFGSGHPSIIIFSKILY
jgi:hypothetical protein